MCASHWFIYIQYHSGLSVNERRNHVQTVSSRDHTKHTEDHSGNTGVSLMVLHHQALHNTGESYLMLWMYSWQNHVK